MVDSAQSVQDLVHKERHENESGAVKTECAEGVQPTLCLVMVGDTTNHQSSNQRRVKRRSEPILLGRFDGSAFKKWDPTQLVVSERKSKSFCQDKNRLRGQKSPLENCPKVPTYESRPV